MASPHYEPKTKPSNRTRIMPDDNPLTITSLQNPRIKHAVRLRQRSHRTADQLTLVEGYREIKRALENRRIPSQLFTCRKFYLGRNEPQLAAACRAAGTELLECAPHVFQKLAYRDRPEGLLAVLPYFHYRLQDINLSATPLLLIAESIEKPGNLGTMLRTADAAGADAVIVCDPRTDIFNPNVIRASIGTLFALPVVATDTSSAADWLKLHHIRILAATPHAAAVYTDADLTGRLALIMGTEQYGLSRDWMERAGLQVRIPMRGQADSLNVAAATTILLFEALRQRGIKQDRVARTDKAAHRNGPIVP